MRYSDDGNEIRVGDRVLVEGDIVAVVICDFDRKECLSGHEDWLTDEEMVGGGRLDTGILVKTEALGYVHYSDPDEAIVRQPG
jgi:hypothetical protein